MKLLDQFPLSLDVRVRLGGVTLKVLAGPCCEVGDHDNPNVIFSISRTYQS